MAYRIYKTYLNWKRKSYNSGAALLELVIVMALLVLIMVALVSLVVLSLSTVQKSRLRARATAIAQDGIERIKAKRLDEKYRGHWDDPAPTPAFERDCPANAQNWAYGPPAPTPDPTVFPTVSANCIVPTPNQVQVETKVGWQFGGKWYDVTLETELKKQKDSIRR